MCRFLWRYSRVKEASEKPLPQSKHLYRRIGTAQLDLLNVPAPQIDLAVFLGSGQHLGQSGSFVVLLVMLRNLQQKSAIQRLTSKFS